MAKVRLVRSIESVCFKRHYFFSTSNNSGSSGPSLDYLLITLPFIIKIYSDYVMTKMYCYFYIELYTETTS